ncbi:hypothetical protein GBAR_LOCUS26552, partial [Geodia barretti]
VQYVFIHDALVERSHVESTSVAKALLSTSRRWSGNPGEMVCLQCPLLAEWGRSLQTVDNSEGSRFPNKDKNRYPGRIPCEINPFPPSSPYTLSTKPLPIPP